jgi:hypothetical protein
LPKEIQELARGAFKLYCQNPAHPSLRLHALEDLKKGHHVECSFSVSITMSYRAIYVSVEGVNVWYWIGTHAEYKKFTGGPR